MLAERMSMRWVREIVWRKDEADASDWLTRRTPVGRRRTQEQAQQPTRPVALLCRASSPRTTDNLKKLLGSQHAYVWPAAGRNLGSPAAVLRGGPASDFCSLAARRCACCSRPNA